MSQNSQTRSQIEFTLSDFFWAAVLAVIVGMSAAVATAQTCTLRTQGYGGGCTDVTVFWFTQTNQSQIARFDLNTFGGKFTAPSSAKNFKIPASCSSGGQVIITEVRTDGSTCSASYSGNLPHNRPCSQCESIGGNGTSIINSANFRQGVSRNALASIFPDPGVTFTDQTAYASSLPLPTSLAGVTVEIEGQLCGLVAVTPGQINFHLPAWLDSGPTETTATIRSTRGSVAQFFGRPQLNPSSPGIFTLAANGTGPAARNWLVVKPNGQQIWQDSLSFNSQDQVFLVLYGTGINEPTAQIYLASNLQIPSAAQFASAEALAIAEDAWKQAVIEQGQVFTALYCGETWMTGVQQIVIPVPIAALSNWPALVSGFVRIGRPGFSFDSQGFDVRR